MGEDVAMENDGGGGEVEVVNDGIGSRRNAYLLFVCLLPPFPSQGLANMKEDLSTTSPLSFQDITFPSHPSAPFPFKTLHSPAIPLRPFLALFPSAKSLLATADPSSPSDSSQAAPCLPTAHRLNPRVSENDPIIWRFCPRRTQSWRGPSLSLRT